MAHVWHQISANVHQAGRERTVEFLCAHKRAKTMETAHCLMFARVRRVGLAMTAPTHYVPRNATMEASVLHLMSANVKPLLTHGLTVDWVEDALSFEMKMVILR